MADRFGIDRRRFMLSAAAVGAGTMLPGVSMAQDARETALIDAAKREGKVVIYSSAETVLLQQTLDAFKKKYGISAEFQRLTTTSLNQRFVAEMQSDASVGDVISAGDTIFLNDAVQKGWLAKVDYLPALAALPKDLWNGHYAPWFYQPLSLAWNTDLVAAADEPKGWQDLLNPKFKGKIVLSDPRASLSITLWAQLMQQTYGDDFLRKLAAQELQVAAGSTAQGAQMIAAGTAAISVPAAHTSIAALVEKGAPLKEIWPNPTTSGGSYLAISSKAKNPNAARLLTSFYLTSEGAAIANRDAWTPIKGVPGTRELPAGFVELDHAKALAARSQLVALLGIK